METYPSKNIKKLTIEIINNLNETVNCFYELNKNSYNKNDLLNAVANGSIAFAGGTFVALSTATSDEKIKEAMKKDAITVFIKYMETIV